MKFSPLIDRVTTPFLDQPGQIGASVVKRSGVGGQGVEEDVVDVEEEEGEEDLGWLESE